MGLDDVKKAAENAAHAWTDPWKSPRARAEEAWSCLVVVRTQMRSMPPELRESFLEVWHSYGNPKASLVSLAELSALLDEMSPEDFKKCEALTKLFAAGLGLAV